MAKKIGVVLSGCGVYDGSEIHEAVFTLLAIDRNGAEAVCMAPEMKLDEVDHLAGAPTGAKRSVLVESARIARGKIRNIAEVQAAINMYRGIMPATTCVDSDKNGTVSIAEVQKVINGYLGL